MDLLDYDVLSAVSVEEFARREPFPWIDIGELLTPEAHTALLADFPSHSLFARHDGMPRMHSQRPHNRLYLAYESSPYSGEDGLVLRSDLPDIWSAFIDELEDSRYRDFIAACLDQNDLRVRYAWHLGISGSEVSPHVDAEVKAGTHIFYFNSERDWDDAWGGATIVLRDRSTPTMNPDFSDFATAEPVSTLGNRSFLFKNTPDAWHGVEPLQSPEGSFRRLFNVIFEYSGAPQVNEPGRMRGRFRRSLRRLRS
jgi:hypothetical protein